MMRLKKLVVLSLAIVGLMLAGTVAKADTLTLTLATPYEIGPQPLFYFYGTISYTSTDAVNNFNAGENLTGDLPVLDAGLILDDSPFLNNAPLTMSLGDTWTGLLFTVAAPPYGAGSNFYTGSFSILGGGDPSDQGVLATDDFNVQVTPEPGSYQLFGMGLLALGFLVKSKLLA
jgi:hypothetical protein